jgi:hypothetical protein
MAVFRTVIVAFLSATILPMGVAAGPVEPRSELTTRQVCGPTVCAEGLSCCNASCGYCTKPGEACTMEACLGPQCGPNTCAFGEVCCNESCGYCTKPGQGCTDELCLGPKCGTNKFCAVGEVCCNESCGYCTKPGEKCTIELCQG